MNQTLWLIAAIVMGIAALVAAAVMYKRIVAESAGDERSKQVAGWIEEGAQSYLKKLYVALIVVSGVLSIIIAVAFGSQGGEGLWHGIEMAICFVSGAAFAAVAGYVGMAIAVKANVRTAVAAQKGLVPAFRLSFNAGTVMGLSTVGVAVVGMAIIYWIFGDPSYVLGFSFGASLLALLAKAGGGIFTKTADIAADLVGKVEVGIPEDDPRNPAVIADNVGDNVGDVAGTGADIFDSYVASTVAAMLLGASMFKDEPIFTLLPIIICVIGVAASLIGVQFVRVKEGGKPGRALNMGTVLTCVFLAVGMAIVVAVTPAIPWAIFWATVIGLVTGVLIGFVSDYYTSEDFKPVLETAKVSGSGSAVNIITGYSYGLVSVVPSVIGIVVATLASYFVTEALMPGYGIYGIGIAAVGMLSVSGMIVSSDAYGPIVDNARGIAEMAGMKEEVIVTCDKLDAAGNTAKAITKGFSISAAALTVLAIFHAYGEEVVAASSTLTELSMDLSDPLIIAGVFLGAIAPPLFSALLMLSVTRNAFDMIEEVRGQFRDDPGILAGTSLPDYAKCVGLAAQGALRSLVGPAFIAIGAPLAVGLLLGPAALGAFLGGAIITGVIFALLMSNAGGLWDNAKKYVETGQFGGKGSEAHKAAVVGDTVGDPFKDTAGPSLNTLITVMSLAASFFAPVIAALSLVK